MIPDILRHVPRKGENLMFNEKKLDELATRMKEKEISIPTDLSGSILFFLLGAVLFFMLPSQVPISENDVINGRVFPKLLFSLMMICSAVLIIQNIIKISKKQPVHDSACATRPSASMRPSWRLSNKSLRRKPQAQSIFS